MLLSVNELILIPLSKEDSNNIVRNRENFLQEHRLHSPTDWPHDGLRAFLPLYNEEHYRDTRIYGIGPWIMVVHSKIVGDITIKYTQKSDVYEIAYYVCESERKKGYATASLKRVCSWLLEREPTVKIIAECYVTNHPSQKVLNNVGFQLVNQEKDIFIYQLKKS